MGNPALIELTRGSRVESTHAGAFAVARADGRVVAALGDIASPVFPRSAIKPLQALAFAAGGAVERFGFTASELAIACASHSGTPRHVAVVTAMLARAGLSEEALGCGVHEPLDAAAARELVRSGEPMTSLHHNCSGKHAGMLVTAVHRGEPVEGYWRIDHPVQARIRQDLEELTGEELGSGVCGIDGCSVPNWAISLAGLAAAFARFSTGAGLGKARAQLCRRLLRACWAEPELVAGPGRLDTQLMTRLAGDVLVKGGAEGVYCGALPVHGLGFALKVDDGAKRAAEAVAVALVARFYPLVQELGPGPRLFNWRGMEVGQMHHSAALARALAPLQ
jgi:L-asparaginase II